MASIAEKSRAKTSSVFMALFMISLWCSSKASHVKENQDGSHIQHIYRKGSTKLDSLKDTTWDFLTFSYSWTQTFCTLQRDNDKSVKCEIPQEVNNLTIHGLWPSTSNKSADPFNCNTSWPFDFDQIKDLEDRLLLQWPNVLTDRGEDSLWLHEWDKHGTCAASLPVLNGQHNYFSQTLDLKNKYDLLGMLQYHGIVPSDDKQYSFDDVFNSLKDSLTTKPYLECYIPEENPSVFYISEMRYCLDKNFNLIDCEKSAMSKYHSRVNKRENQPCSSKHQLMLPIIKH